MHMFHKALNGPTWLILLVIIVLVNLALFILVTLDALVHFTRGFGGEAKLFVVECHVMHVEKKILGANVNRQKERLLESTMTQQMVEEASCVS